MSVSVTLKSYFYEVLIPSSQKNTSSPIEDILHHVSISFMKKLALYKCFNPRTHTGCDLLGKVLTTRLYSFQSTHPHGVRLSLYQLKKVLEEFQSTHPHGVRQSQALTPHAWHRFQSTHPHGVRRLILSRRATPVVGFNPRTHTGCDLPRRIPLHRMYCFNPRTHTGCDYLSYAVPF